VAKAVNDDVEQLYGMIDDVKKDGKVVDSTIVSKVRRIYERHSPFVTVDSSIPLTDGIRLIRYIQTLISELEFFCSEELTGSIRIMDKLLSSAELADARRDVLIRQGVIAEGLGQSAAAEEIESLVSKLRKVYPYADHRYKTERKDRPPRRTVRQLRKQDEKLLHSGINLRNQLSLKGLSIRRVFDYDTESTANETGKGIILEDYAKADVNNVRFELSDGIGVGFYSAGGGPGAIYDMKVTPNFDGVVTFLAYVATIGGNDADPLLRYAVVPDPIPAIKYDGQTAEPSADGTGKWYGHVKVEQGIEIKINIDNTQIIFGADGGYALKVMVLNYEVDVSDDLGRDSDLLEAGWSYPNLFTYENMTPEMIDLQRVLDEVRRYKTDLSEDADSYSLASAVFPATKRDGTPTPWANYTGHFSIYDIMFWMRLPLLLGISKSLAKERWLIFWSRCQDYIVNSTIDCAYHEHISS
jgi:hypothetical protein